MSTLVKYKLYPPTLRDISQMDRQLQGWMIVRIERELAHRSDWEGIRTLTTEMFSGQPRSGCRLWDYIRDHAHDSAPTVADLAELPEPVRNWTIRQIVYSALDARQSLDDLREEAMADGSLQAIISHAEHMWQLMHGQRPVPA